MLDTLIAHLSAQRDAIDEALVLLRHAEKLLSGAQMDNPCGYASVNQAPKKAYWGPIPRVKR